MHVWILVFHNWQSWPLVKIRAGSMPEAKAGLISSPAVGNDAKNIQGWVSLFSSMAMSTLTPCLFLSFHSYLHLYLYSVWFCVCKWADGEGYVYMSKFLFSNIHACFHLSFSRCCLLVFSVSLSKCHMVTKSQLGSILFLSPVGDMEVHWEI